jgi:hypothetical protein
VIVDAYAVAQRLPIGLSEVIESHPQQLHEMKKPPEQAAFFASRMISDS